MRRDVIAVIPAYRCAQSIGPVVEGVRRHLDRVIVVDDGSDDDTAVKAERAGAKVVRSAVNEGKGAALRRGIAAALEDSPPAVLLLDADGQHDPADVPALIGPWERGEADLVIGSRWGGKDSSPGARYWTNYIGSRVLSWMTGVELFDSQSGYRLLDGELVRRLQLRSRRYAIESEIVIKAARLGARLAHVPVRTIYGENPSHFRPVLDTFRISCAAIYFKVFDDR
jgi:glycosyltransferase involved in cell wall biosynthesis